jgi:TonB family protein
MPATADMKAEEFENTVKKLEAKAATNPKGYLLDIAGLALLGYCYIFGVIVFLLFMVLFFVWLLLVLHAWILLKFSFLFLIAAWYVLKSLWVKFGEPEGVEIKPSDAPELFRLLAEINSVAKAPKIDKVVLNETFNCAVMQVPRLGLFGWYKNFLILGLPLMQSVSLPEFKGVLAHELGHLSDAHGKMGCWVYHVSASWRQTYLNLAYQSSIGIGLIKRFAIWFLPLFDAHSLVLRREHEYAADRISAQIAGPEIAAQALIQTAVKASFLEDKYWHNYWKQIEHSAEPPWNTFSSIKTTMQVPLDHDTAFELLQKNWAKHDPDDTHPALSERVRALLPHKDWSNPVEIAGEAAQFFSVERTAADEIFAKKLPALEAEIEARWHKQIGEAWLSRYRSATEKRQRLIFLEEAAHHRELQKEELHEIAQLSYYLDDGTLAIEKYRHLLMTLPDDPHLHFGLGVLLLGEKDEGGIKELEESVRLRPAYGSDAYAAIAGFLRARGKESEAEQYAKKSYSIAEEISEAEAALNCIKPNDIYEEHKLTQDKLDAICVAISRDSRINSAYIIAKKVPEIVGGHQHFLLLKLGFGNNDVEKAQQVLNELAILPELAGFYLLTWPAATKKLANACTTLPTGLVFDRKTWSGPMSEVVLSPQAQRFQTQPKRTFFQQHKNNLIVAGAIAVFLLLFALTSSNVNEPSRRNTTGGASHEKADSSAPSATPQSEGPYAPYMRDLQARIKRCWQPPRGKSSSRVVLLFSVNDDGSIGKHVRITKSAGSKELDHVAVKALLKAAPFAPLPAGLKGPVDVSFAFDYNVHD